MIKSFKDLEVWQVGHELVLEVYRLTRGFPREETYGLTSQLRRSAVSVPANIAEGFTRKTTVDKLRFLNIAQGSLEETRYYLLLARDLHYGELPNCETKLIAVSKMLHSCIRSLESRL
jgi:four helix bundle protein